MHPMPYHNPETFGALLKGIASGTFTGSRDVHLIDRHAVEEAILSTFSFTTSLPNKLLLCLGGGQCSGKTVTRNLILKATPLAGEAVQIGSDVFKEHIPEYQALRNMVAEHEAKAHGVDIEALRAMRTGAFAFIEDEMHTLIRKTVERATHEKCGLIIDSQMHNAPLFRDIVEGCKKQGYETVLIHPHINMDTYFRRAAQRITSGKRVNHEEFIGKHKQFAQHWDEYMAHFDAALMLNSNPSIRAGNIPTIVSIALHGKNMIFDEATYAEARHKIHLNPQAKTPQEAYPNGVGSQDIAQLHPTGLGSRASADGGRGTAHTILSMFLQRGEASLSR